MYIEDVAEFARVLLTTTEMTYGYGWQPITVNCPGALLYLRYRDIGLTLIRDPEGGQPHLNEFKIPEIIFDPSLALSPHVTLLSMLFHVDGFKRFSNTGPVLDSPEKLYSLRPLLLKDELLDKFVFCQVQREPTGYRLVLEESIISCMIRSRMCRGGKITGYDQVSHLYNLRYAGAK
ncbi:uncharacterized protein N7483_004682 [Penicillium malachiteum]|uniref:uncharacterized protein n=1 Tax=Penicillium malachiteum TaxID=1324776 RepID=UPI002547A70A|nr:uncharacterized protein N7483_004682 [Penicillium malachiteum]KAJ5730174.1 hypothetical protein N7483_004682 [Penicillium malachiteum]